MKNLMSVVDQALDLFDSGDVVEDYVDRPHVVAWVQQAVGGLLNLKALLAEEMAEDEIDTRAPACPECGHPMSQMLFMGVKPDGWVHCGRYYNDDGTPLARVI